LLLGGALFAREAVAWMVRFCLLAKQCNRSDGY